ncbi:rhodanese-like domain-containing protein [Candidatus Gracilibacteria bacterium]|nr:rhodanese-like domain-containing protein [Candidatus Gracilibacteria bacterium]
MKLFIASLIGGIVGASLIIGVYHTLDREKNPFLEYYTVENAVAVSPHDIKLQMDKGDEDFIIVDLRSRGEYSREHIKGAINIPGSDGDKNALDQEKRIVDEFKKLPTNKRIIVHCYTHYCMLAKHVGLMVAKEGINVHELNIGWNEWRYEWDLWNGNGTSKTIDINDYLEGTEVKKDTTPKTSTGFFPAPCTADGLAGC